MKTHHLFFALTLFMLSLFSASAQQQNTIFFEDFESGWGSWYADNGLWEVGVPVVGPENTYSGQNCAGTDLDAGYPYGANTRLISPSIALPNVSGEETIQFKFYQWHEMENEDDQGQIQVSANGGDWVTISEVDIDGSNPAWSQFVADLTPFAGSSVRVAFYFTTDYNYNYAGWYIDDILIETGVVAFPSPEDFEYGVGEWSADNGLWEVGTPSVGPTYAHSGTNCAGTVLDGGYPYGANTRLISPSIDLPYISGEETIQFKFFQWYEMENEDDQGQIQISVNGGEWVTISEVDIDGSNPTWSQFVADLTPFAGSSVRVAFYFTTDYNYNYAGWYVDDVSIETVVVSFPNPEDFESGVGEWSADNGLWEVGTPSVGPTYVHSGTNCAGTVLDGGYPYGANTRLISPEIMLIPNPGENPMLFFYQWFSMENNDDNGYIQLSVNNGEWQTVSNPITGSNETWSQYGLNLSDYADSNIRIAFYFTSDFNYNYSGWYIDDIRIEGTTVNVIEPEDQFSTSPVILHQNYPNPFNGHTQISFDLQDDEHVTLSVYNSIGQLVKILADENFCKGHKAVVWDGCDEGGIRVAPGAYWIRLVTDAWSGTRKMIKLKSEL